MQYKIFILICSALFVQTAQGQGDTLLTLQRDALTFDRLVPMSNRTQNVEVVSASRSLQRVGDLPLTIRVISREEILLNGYNSLSDVLKMMPGVRVSQPGSAELGDLFLFRGLIGNSYVKILLNGLPITPSVKDGLPISAQLPIRQAERIEVIYGPASAVYGADAAAGVINIITNEHESTNAFAHADAELGQFGHNYLSFEVGGKLGKNEGVWQYSLFGNNYGIEDMNLGGHPDLVFNPLSYYMTSPENLGVVDAETLEPIPVQDLNESLFENSGITAADFMDELYQPNYLGTLTRPEINEMPRSARSLGLGLRHKGLRIDFINMQRRDFSSFGRTPWVYSLAYPQSYYGENITRVSASYMKEWKEGLKTVTNLSYLNHRLDNGSSFAVNYDNGGNGFAYIYEAADDIFVEQLVTLNPIPELEILVGATFQYTGNLPQTNEMTEPFDTKDYRPFSTKKPAPNPYWEDFGYYPVNFKNLSGFLQLFYTRGDFTLIAGLRSDHNSIYGGTINPRIAGLYKFNEKLSVRGSFASSFNAPSTSQAYSSLSLLAEPENPEAGVIYAIVPNPDLKPEIAKNYELAARYNFSSAGFLDISLFRSEIENLIKPSVGEIDDQIYINAISELVSRTSLNSEEALSNLFGIQATLGLRKLAAPINLGIDLSISISDGEESLQESTAAVKDFRMLPNAMGQLRIFGNPLKKVYVNMEHSLLGSWYRRYTPNLAAYQNREVFKVDGYFNLDMLVRYQLNELMSTYIRVRNVLNTQYGGIAPTGFDVDMLYNPQPGRMIQGGISFAIN